MTFSQSFTSAPLVFCTVQSRNGSDVPRVCDVKAVTSTGFDLGFCEAEDTQTGTCDSHSDEQVGWIAIGEDTGADLAEYYRSTELLEKGEIVEPDPNNSVFVRRGNGRSELPPIGVVSSNPGKVMGKQTEDSHLVALSGRVPVKVTMEDGPIATGDKIAPSLIRSGHGKKFRAGGQYSIGIALNNQNKSGKVMVLLSNETHFSENDHYRQELNAKDEKIKKLRIRLQRQEREISQMKEAIKSIQHQMRIKK